MRSDSAKTLNCSAFAVVAVSACSQPVSQSMQQMPQEIDVSEPAETGICVPNKR